MNKYMHPRNIYKVPPDFTKLKKLYNDFAAIAKTDVTGKVTIDFKNPSSLRVLTKCLLKSDFDLDVTIPEDRLVPTLPLRLNYILWLEDLLTALDLSSDIKGVDIGTGACAIYPLLAAKKNKWQMLGTETDTDSIRVAQQNIDKNQLQELIQISHNTTESIIKYLFMNENEQTFHFCMCNPPFYSNYQELCESRSPARPPPKNGFTGSLQELVTEGGELEFCRKIIKESKDHQNNIMVYTTMVGHKYSLVELIQDLKADGIKYTHTEFCQGRITRWGLAWTYKDYDLYKLVPPREKLRKKTNPTVYLLPELPNCVYNFDECFKRIKNILQELNIAHKIIEKRAYKLTVDIVATTNTWSNQRRKRRLQKRLEEEAKRKKVDDIEKTTDLNVIVGNEISPNQSNENILNGFSNGNLEDRESSTGLKVMDNDSSTSDTVREDTDSTPVVHALMTVFKKDKDVLMKMEFYEGTAGKEGLHQIVQYIKNKWK